MVTPDTDWFGRTRWIDWFPTYTNLTLGNGTVTARYVQVGQLVRVFYHLVFGSTTSISGVVTVSLPVTANENLYYSAGGVAYLDGTVILVGGYAISTNGTTITLYASNHSPTTYTLLSALSSTVPFTWTTGDDIYINLAYEAA